MTIEERRAALHALIDGHTETMAALRASLKETAAINDAFERAAAAFHDAGQGLARTTAAHERAIDASLATMRAALTLLDDAAGVQ